MRSGIVAIPLFAAMWLATPTLGAQEKDSRKDSPRIAVSRTPEQSAQRANPPQADRADRGDSGKTKEPRVLGGGEAGARGGEGERGAPQSRYAVGRVTPRGYTETETRAVARRGPATYTPVNRGPVVINNYNSYRRPTYYAPPVYYDRWARNYYGWSPLRYAPWGLIYGSVGFSNFGFYGAYGTPAYGVYPGYGYPSPYGGSPYPPYYSSSYDMGGVRLQIRPRDAQVFVDGYYAGLVDDFDGTFQSLKLEPGGHKLEIRMPGFQTLELDIHVQPNRTITIREDLIP